MNSRNTRPRLVNRLSTGRTDWYRIENVVQGDTARVILYDEIGFFGITAADFVKDMEALNVRNIDLRVNSPGGSVFDGVAIHNALKNHPAKVTATVDGLAASAASFICMAADEVVMEPNATMMIHDGLTMVVGNAADLRKEADLLDKVSNQIADMYAAKTGRPADDFRALMQVETWLTADEALELGLADRIAGQDPEEADDRPATNRLAAQWDLSIFNFAGRDQAPAPVLPTQNAAPAVEAPPIPTAPPFDLAAVIRTAIQEVQRP